MLIDAAHPEEIRVAVMDGNTLEELDVESTTRQQLKGNIYLAKVTRVEPSLQAAFVDYGGNRHGFLAFSEIHPDYYQIPVADRNELLAEESAASENSEIDEEINVENNDNLDKNDVKVETVGGDDIDEVSTHRKFFPAKRYKIQEVIKRRQILLIQVEKEERGQKGAALTTYISLAGRYCVLMPNTGKGGGISRKISNTSDRKRLKTIISDFDFPQGMAVIIRTAGADRSKAEIKRDYEYLIKLWGNVRELTLESTAPSLVHEEGSIIKRAVRDHYSRDIEEVIIEGDNGYRQAKDLMKMLIPSHAKKVQPYKDTIIPIFNKYQIEDQLNSMNSRQVQLKSGGYIVIDITEALVAIDVNSGRATRGRNIEETALKTNVEAAMEVARQLRLRDLAGLVVIDFIDMEANRNQVKVERRLKEAMRIDRARIQIGRISPFGLLELSRQRLRPSITETMTEICPHCGGSGNRRSIESTALHVLRGIEEECASQKNKELQVSVHSQVALYVLNQKREAIAEIEKKFNLKVIVLEDDNLIPPEFSINRGITEKSAQTSPETRPKNKVSVPNNNSAQTKPVEDGEKPGKKSTSKRRRRSRKHSRNTETKKDESLNTLESENINDENSKIDAKSTKAGSSSNNTETGKPTRRRRGIRSGRRRNKNQEKAISKTSGISDDTSKITSDDNLIQSGSDLNVPNTEVSLDSIDSPPITKSDNKHTKAQRKRSNEPNKKGEDGTLSNSISNDGINVNSEKKTKTDAETENSYTPNVTVVGEIKNTAQKNERGGWWNKITGG